MTARTSLVRLSVVSLAALFALSATARAQSIVPSSRLAIPVATEITTVDSAATTPVGPSRDAASLAVRSAAEPNHSPAPAPAKSGFTQSEGLMILGGAAILTGIVVGNNAGHAISVAGAVVGLIGLYQYLQ